MSREDDFLHLIQESGCTSSLQVGQPFNFERSSELQL